MRKANPTHIGEEAERLLRPYGVERRSGLVKEERSKPNLGESGVKIYKVSD